VGRETARICAEEAFYILVERTLDSGEIVATVAERTGLKSPRKAVTEVLRAYKKVGIVVGGGKGSTKYRLVEMG
jgi:uridylate kinase